MAEGPGSAEDLPKVKYPHLRFCQQCLQEKPDGFCHHCDAFICGNCIKQHKKMKVFSDHEIVALDELAKGEIKMKVDVCQQCSEDSPEGFCCQCTAFICKNCMIQHKKMKAFVGHEVLTLDEIREGEGKSKVESALKNVTSSVKEVAGAVGSFFTQLFPNDKHRTYKMVLIGETGSGKTSFLNLMCNCSLIQSLGGEFNESGFARFKQFHKLELENPNSKKMESKTSDATVYNVKVGKLKVGIIDTPGFGDSGGFERDHENVKKIIVCLQSQDYVHCICLIINGRQARTSPYLQYVLTQITSILPKEILSNVIVVFSNTARPLDLNFDADSLKDFFGKPLKHIFYIENPYCRLEKAKKKRDKLPLEDIVKDLQKSFHETAETLKEMCVAMNTFKKVHTSRFKDLFSKKEKIESYVLRLMVEYDNQKELENLIDKAQKEAEAALAAKELNKEFHSVYQGKRIVVVNTESHNTLCQYPNCTTNCHPSCQLDKSFDKEAFRHCWCMRPSGGETCRVCGHAYNVHYHGEQVYKKEEYITDFVDKDMKKKFEEAKTNEQRASIFQRRLDLQRKNSIAKRKHLSNQVLLAITDFQKLGVNRNYAKLIETQLILIDVRLAGSVGEDTKDIQAIKAELKKKYQIVLQTLDEPWSRDADPSMRYTWACKILELDADAPLTKENVAKAYRDAAKVHHGDRGGSDEAFKQITCAKDILMKVVK